MVKSKIKNRESFLNNISKHLRRPIKVTKPERLNRTYNPERNTLAHYDADELAIMFTEISAQNQVTVVQTNRQSLEEDVEKILTEHGEGQIVIPKDQRFSEYNLKNFKNEHNVYEWTISKGDENISIAEKAKTGVMFSDFSLAESGTVVTLNNKYNARVISLLPETFIAIVPKSTLVPRFTQVCTVLDEQYKKDENPSNYINFISGPSNSADLAYTFVVGVHGPVKVSYLLVMDG